MNKEIIEESVRFTHKIESVCTELTSAIKEQVIQLHTLQEYWSADTKEMAERRVIVQNISYGVNLTNRIYVDLITGEQSTETNYSLHTNILAGNAYISDGRVSYLVHLWMEAHIDFSEFPNFTKNRFSTDGKEII